LGARPSATCHDFVPYSDKLAEIEVALAEWEVAAKRLYALKVAINSHSYHTGETDIIWDDHARSLGEAARAEWEANRKRVEAEYQARTGKPFSARAA
jgi:hypothetical protein